MSDLCNSVLQVDTYISKLWLLEALIIYSAILTETSFIERSTWSLIVSSLSSSLRVGELSATCDCLLILLLAGLLLLDCLVDGLLDGLMGVLVEGFDLEGLLLSDSLIVSSSSLLSPACKHPDEVLCLFVRPNNNLNLITLRCSWPRQ